MFPIVRPTFSLLAFATFVAALTAWHLRPVRSMPAAASGDEKSALLIDPVARVPERLVYPFSVVAGGVASAEEAQSAASRDSTIRTHYNGVRLEQAWMADNPQSRLVHVSYRKGDRIYWTRNKVRIAAGEQLLTDGANAIRARCGNRIAATPLGEVEPSGEAPGDEVLDTPVLDEEPMEETRLLEDPVVRLTPEPEAVLTAAQTQPQMSWWLVSPAPWSGGSYLLYPLNPHPLPLYPLYPPLELETSSLNDEPQEGDPAEIPESSTLALMAIGLAALYFGRASRRRAVSRF